MENIIKPTNPITEQKPIVPMNSITSKFNFNKKSLKMAGIGVAIFLVLIILISIIVNSLKNINKPNTVVPTASPDETLAPLPVSTESGELSIYRVQLQDLKTQINNLDIGQSYLKPPVINFKINF